MKRSIAVARLWLEVNSFSPVPTVLADFEAKEWLIGPVSRRPARLTGSSWSIASW